MASIRNRSEIEQHITDLVICVTKEGQIAAQRDISVPIAIESDRGPLRGNLTVNAGGHGGLDMTITEYIDAFSSYDIYRKPHLGTVIYTLQPGTTGRATVTIKLQ